MVTPKNQKRPDLIIALMAGQQLMAGAIIERQLVPPDDMAELLLNDMWANVSEIPIPDKDRFALFEMGLQAGRRYIPVRLQEAIIGRLASGIAGTECQCTFIYDE